VLVKNNDVVLGMVVGTTINGKDLTQTEYGERKNELNT
jgi:hypothetical protein